MTELLMQDSLDATSTSMASTDSKSLLSWSLVEKPICVGMLFVAGAMTSSVSAYADDYDAMQVAMLAERTTAGVMQSNEKTEAAPVRAGSAIGELRRVSGLTWAQLARLFDVKPRSLHFWSSGKPMNARNEEHLQRTLATLRFIDRGSASANRRLLLEPDVNDVLPLDLLANKEYDRVRELFGRGVERRAPQGALSKEAQQARAPSPPEELVGALQDRIHRDEGKIRIAKSVKVRSGG